MRLCLALLTLLAVVGAADWFGWGHNYLGIVLLSSAFYLARRLPPRGWRVLLAALLGFSVLVAALAVAQMWYVPRPPGPFRSANFLGWFAVLCFFLAAIARSSSRPGHRGIAESAPAVPETSAHIRYVAAGRFCRTIPIAANFLSLALSQSRGAICAFAAGVLSSLWWRRPVAATLIVWASLVAVLTIRPGLEEARLTIWHVGWQAFTLRPLLGYGQGGIWIGGLGGFYSVPLDLALSAGILGLLAGAWLYIEGVIAAWRQPAMLGFLAAWLVGGLFIYGTPATLVPLFLVLGRLSRPEEVRQPEPEADDIERRFRRAF